jgi:hypothetical protein
LEIRRLHQRINFAKQEKFYRRLDRQQILRNLAIKDGRWKIGKYIPLEELEGIAVSMLKSNEKIEAKVAGSYTIESSFGNYEIVKGFLAATNHRVLAVLTAPMQKIRQDHFTFSQINVVSITSDGRSISLIMPDEVITLFDVIDDCDDLEKFCKYITDVKTPLPKTTIEARHVKITPPPQKPFKVQQNFFRKIWSIFLNIFLTRKKFDI